MNSKVRNFLQLFSVLFLTAHFSYSQTLTITSPKAGDVYYVGDTMTVTFTADQAFINKMSAKALMVDIAPDNGLTYCIVVPIGKTVNRPSIPVADPLWGNAQVIITDSLTAIADDGSDSLISSLSNEALFKLYDYGNGDVCNAIVGPFSIRPASERPASVLPVTSVKPALKKTSGNKNSGCGNGVSLAFFPAFWLRRRKILGAAKKIVMVCGVPLAILAVAGLSTLGCADQKAVLEKQLPGSWTHKTEARTATIQFGADGSYILDISNMKKDYPGTWSIDSGKLVMTDTYCGNRLPGKYSVSVKNKTLVFTLAEDKFCDRNLLMPGVWTRTDK